MKHRVEMILYGVLGGLLVAIAAPFLLSAAQTYVLPGTPTPRAELVSNIPARDESLRSCFSGTSAPTNPTPVDGQCWYDTANNIYHRRINGAWVPIATTTGTQTLSGKTLASPTITGSATASVGSAFTASAACASGYKRAGAWCLAVSGDNPAHSLSNVSTSAVNDTTVDWSTLNGAKAAMLGLGCMVSEDATPGSAQTRLYVREATAGDQTPSFYQCFTGTAEADQTLRTTTTVIVPLDANGDFEYETTVLGTVNAREVLIWLMGYLD